MRTLTLAPVWVLLSWALVAVAVYLSVGPSGAADAVWVMPFPYHDKLGHFLAYAIMMLWFAGLFRRSRWVFVAQGLLLLGLLLELAQGHLDHRQMNFGDLIANASGVGAGLLLALTGLDRWCVWVEQRLGWAR